MKKSIHSIFSLLSIRIIALLIFIIIAPDIIPYSKACGNEYGITLTGRFQNTRYIYLSDDMYEFDRKYLKERLDELNEKIKNGSATYTTWSDIALNLMKSGKADSAIKILQPLAVKYPNEYNIIANLGTAYELIGKLDSALKYIKRDLEINPDSHYKSEWIHVKILEAKIKEKRNPGWLNKNPVIDIKELFEGKDSVSIQRDFFMINNNFIYQIRTRVPFTPAPDPIIANLLVSLGDMNRKYGTYENALLAYAYAIKFQPSNHQVYVLEEKIRRLNRSRDSLNTKEELPFMFMDLMKRSKLSPQLLVMGLDDFANEQDSLYKTHQNLRDSVRLLKSQLDSTKSQKTISEREKVQEETNESVYAKYIYLALGLGFGVLATYFIIKKRKHS